MRRITLDTNSYINALEFEGRATALLGAGRDGLIHIYISQPIIDELFRVLREEFQWTDEELAEAEAVLNSSTHLVKPTVILQVVKNDPDDDKIVECAVSSRSEAIITNDKDLLRMRLYDGIRMMRVGQFLREMEQEQGRLR